MPNFLFAPDAALPLIGRRDDAADDTFLFAQGPTGGLGKVRFHDWRASFDSYAHLPNVALLREQIDVLDRDAGQRHPGCRPAEGHRLRLRASARLFATVPYAQLILEEAGAVGRGRGA